MPGDTKVAENPDPQRTLSQTLAAYPWLLFEVLTLLVLLSLILGYPDFDADLKLLTRAFLVFSLSSFVIGATHVLAIERNFRRPLPPIVAYGFISCRVLLIVAFVWWLHAKSLL